MTQMFYSEGDVAEQANLDAAPGEPERKPGQTGMFLQAADLEKQLRRRNRGALIAVLVLLVVAAAGVVFALYGQAILGPPGADRQARQDLDAAMLIVKKDDAASLQAADKAIADILARKPLYMAAKADRALVQQFLADNSLWQTERLKASYDALGKQIRQITARNDPNEAPQRVKDTEAMTAINKQYETVGKQAKAFEDQGKALIDEAAKAEPKNPVVLRAQAFLTADHDQAEGTQKLTRLYLRESGAGSAASKDGWAELALAESDVAGKPSEEKRTDGLTHAKAALALDPALVRARLLEVRLDAVNKKEAEAKADAAALTAANPAHSGGAAQVAALEEELTREKVDKDAHDAKVAAQAKADAALEAQAAQAAQAAAAEDAKKPAPKAAAKRNR